MDDGDLKSLEKMTDEELYTLAAKRVKARANFFVHLVVYVMVLLLLKFGVNLTPDAWVIIACAWGIGVISQGISVYTLGNHKVISKEYEKMKKNMRE